MSGSGISESGVNSMSSDEEPTQVERTRHEKRRTPEQTGGIDGGSIAAGLVVPLAGLSTVLVLEVGAVAGLAIMSVTLFLGGFITASIRSRSAGCVFCHAAGTALAVAAIGGAAGVATVIAENGFEGAGFVELVLADELRLLTAIALAVGLSMLGAMVESGDRAGRP